MIKFTPKDDTPELRQAAKIAETWLNRPEIQAKVAAETQTEICSQLLYGNEPSEGMPDIRPRRYRWQKGHK